jgi:TPR repeat protein
VQAALGVGAVHYERGQDVEALKWFKRIAEQGDPDGMFNLGFMYGAGRGITQDDKVHRDILYKVCERVMIRGCM